MINDTDIGMNQKIQIMQHIQTNFEEFLLPQTAKMMEEFENLIDSLIYQILAFSRIDQNEEVKSINK